MKKSTKKNRMKLTWQLMPIILVSFAILAGVSGFGLYFQSMEVMWTARQHMAEIVDNEINRHILRDNDVEALFEYWLAHQDELNVVYDDEEYFTSIEDKYRYKFLGFSNPGENRQESIWNALKDTNGIVEEKTVVIVHDAARPLVSKGLLMAGIEALVNHDGAMPVIPMKDTIYYTEDRKTVSSLINREKVVSGQAPEFFDFNFPVK